MIRPGLQGLFDLAPLDRFRHLMGNSADELKQRVLETAQERLHDLVGSLQHHYGLSAAAHVAFGSPSTHIIEQEQEADCDLIVMGKHGQSMLDEFFVGSVTKHVLAESQCDVLVSV